MRHRYLAAAIALALVGTLHAAHAAAAPRQDARDSRTTAANTARNDKAMPTSVTNLETVKVTARRYEETLQDVPIAVTALTARALTDNNVRNLAKNPAGLAVSRRRLGHAIQRRCSDRRPVGIR